ncbi:MAG: hypothetical protein A2057_10775 [Ignavibacteria bacterium GWA2_35_9]|nr:MAG: hypothetical protein A2057_10775 [Ignavibacteria bacterium GWA2_35_9]OGU44576.1 MAG: hypothetical protein A2000_05505 [Ignavibacteria bacterium GWB2_36_8]OGU49833.1 MAG: hypothetical protein A2080_04240 [Ignavibacteria bacterium GWC2_36_12]
MKKFYLLILITISLIVVCDKDENPIESTDSGIVIYEGKTYHTITIGNQVWLKENLDVGTIVHGNQNQTNNGIIEKYYYDNNSGDSVYGGLYQWDEAMQYSSTERARGICPQGWHIPTVTEWEILATTLNNDGNSLKAIGQGSGNGAGTNTSGFSALLAGERELNGSFGFIGSSGGFWTSTERGSDYARSIILYNNNSTIGFNDAIRGIGLSVRCIKD